MEALVVAADAWRFVSARASAVPSYIAAMTR